MANKTVPTTAPPETAIDQSMHALPPWFARFQRSFGLTFLVTCSAYLMGKLATLGWVKDLLNPGGWGWFDGAGVILFFLGGVTISGIALTCSLTFARNLQARPFGIGNAISALFTLVGMLVFFGIEVWAALAERSVYLIATPVDKAVIAALGFHGTPPISPTVVIVSVMFPLGSLYFGFVQQGRTTTTAADIAADANDLQRQIQREKMEAQLEKAKAQKRAARFRGGAQAFKAGVDGLRADAPPADDEDDGVPVASNGHVPEDNADFR